MVKVAVNGAAGRMGQRIAALVHADPDLILAAALEAAGSSALGRDAGEVAGIGNIGVSIAEELSEHVDVVIDFSTPAGLAKIAEVCGQRQIALGGRHHGFDRGTTRIVTPPPKPPPWSWLRT